MSELDAIAAALGARVTPGVAGTLLTFRCDDAWLTMTARASPHLELSLPAPELVGLRLRVQLGVPTLLCTAAPDQRWRMESNDPVWAARLLGEAPWPCGPPPPPPGPGPLAKLARILAQYLSYGAYQSDFGNGSPPEPRYVLEVADGVATIERRTSEVDDVLAVGAAHRLIQLVMRTGRMQRAAAAAPPAPPPRRGPYR